MILSCCAILDFNFSLLTSYTLILYKNDLLILVAMYMFCMKKMKDFWNKIFYISFTYELNFDS